MARGGSSSSGGGCGGLIAVLIVIGAIVAAAISLAAIVDPFGFGSTVAALRKARLARYDSAAAMQAFREAHSTCRGTGQTLAALAALPLLVAIA